MKFKFIKNTVLLFVVVLLSCGNRPCEQIQEKIVVGANQQNLYLPLLKEKNVGVVANQTSVIFTNNSSEISKLIIDQFQTLNKIAQEYGEKVTHIKPHGALNNMACEDYDVAYTIGECIRNFDKELIYLVLLLKIY